MMSSKFQSALRKILHQINISPGLSRFVPKFSLSEYDVYFQLSYTIFQIWGLIRKKPKIFYFDSKDTKKRYDKKSFTKKDLLKIQNSIF